MGWPSVNAKAIGIARLTGYDGLGLHAELLAKIGRIEIFSPAQDLALCIEIVDGDEGVRDAHPMHRSEEHTSELQSLMRISYAVFCLKKQTQKKKTHTNTPIQATKNHTDQ